MLQTSKIIPLIIFAIIFSSITTKCEPKILTTEKTESTDDNYVGFQIITKKPYKDPINTNVTGVLEYNCLQIWETNVVTFMRMGYDTHNQVKAAIEMRVITKPSVTHWIHALELLSATTRQEAAGKQSLYGKVNLWETRFEWWTKTDTRGKKITDVIDLPLSYAALETELRTITRDAPKACSIWPQKDFIGFKWTNMKLPPELIRPVTPTLEKWINLKISRTPQQLYQIIKKREIPTELLNSLTFYNRWITINTTCTNAPTGVQLDFFQIPN